MGNKIVGNVVDTMLENQKAMQAEMMNKQQEMQLRMQERQRRLMVAQAMSQQRETFTWLAGAYGTILSGVGVLAFLKKGMHPKT
jgi:hypothetical protein